MNLNGVDFFTLAEVAAAAGVTRQTLWRWRVDARIPQGRRYRDRIILYTATEREEVCQFANRLDGSGHAGATLPVEGGRS